MAVNEIKLEVPEAGWLSLSECALRSGVNRAYLGELISRGQLDCTRVVDAGGRVLATWVDPRVLEAWMRQRRPRRSPS